MASAAMFIASSMVKAAITTAVSAAITKSAQ
jgi:hypothetical protein